MIVYKNDMLTAVNRVMAGMFFLLPDVDELGRQVTGGPAPGQGMIMWLPVEQEIILQFIYEEELLNLMTSNLAALPVDELPMDWIRQMPTEASKVIWGQYLTLFDREEAFAMIQPCQSENRIEITGARWHFNYQSENKRLSVSLVEQAHL